MLTAESGYFNIKHFVFFSTSVFVPVSSTPLSLLSLELFCPIVYWFRAAKNRMLIRKGSFQGDLEARLKVSLAHGL